MFRSCNDQLSIVAERNASHLTIRTKSLHFDDVSKTLQIPDSFRAVPILIGLSGYNFSEAYKSYISVKTIRHYLMPARKNCTTCDISIISTCDWPSHNFQVTCLTMLKVRYRNLIQMSVQIFGSESFWIFCPFIQERLFKNLILFHVVSLWYQGWYVVLVSNSLLSQFW